MPAGFLAKGIERGEVYLARWDGQVIGTFMLQWSDAELWGERPDDAGYIHKLAVSRSFGGQGLGAKMLAWAERKVAAAGRQYLRLDCVADIPGLNQYYRRLGFSNCGYLEAPGGKCNF